MQSTLPSRLPARSPESPSSPAPGTSKLVVSPTSLLAAFATVPDPRRRQGTRFALPALLALTVAAILSNHLSVLAIAEWGANQCRERLQALGFTAGVTPHQSTLQRLLRKLDSDALSQVLASYFAKTTPGSSGSREPETEPRPRGSQAVAIDGKAQRGRLAFDSSGCPVHALSAYLHEYGVVLAQEPIEPHPYLPAPTQALAPTAAPIATAESGPTHANDQVPFRTWQEKGQSKCQVRYGITSLPPQVADAERLLELKRGHWQIENCDHRIKDVTMGEDASLVHLGNGSSAMATLRDLALSLLHRAGFRAIASRLRYHSTHPEEAVAMLTDCS